LVTVAVSVVDPFGWSSFEAEVTITPMGGGTMIVFVTVAAAAESPEQNPGF
jgi:hypothetical protein